MCCKLCGCLGFCPEKASRDISHDDVEFFVVDSRTDLETSFLQGCEYCGLASRASLLLKSAKSNPSLELGIGIYSTRPTEISAVPPLDYYDIIEMYAAGSKALSLSIFNHSSPDAGASTISLVGKDVPTRSDSGEAMAFMQDCYKQFVKNHVKCDTRSAILPKRVLDISSPSLRLVESDGQIPGAYAALSYTWGDLKYKIATSETLQELKNGVSWTVLPAVFQEAVTIARMLGLEYIWIDTMCILQDDPVDWEIEASKMAQTFSDASVVLVASSSPDPGHSFLTAYTQEFHSITLQLNARPSETYQARRKILLVIHAPFTSPNYNDPIETRGWTMQELELSTRAILFTRAEVQWRCNERHSCQCRTTPEARRSTVKPSLDAGLAHSGTDAHYEWQYEWHRTVQRYSIRRLTYAKDKLPALMGLAQRYQSLNGYTYIAGLWKESLLDDLAWKRHTNGAFRPVSQYLAPTFSWASVSTAVDYMPLRSIFKATKRHTAKVLNYQCNLIGASTFGQVSDGMLTICGPTIKATLRCATPQDPQAYELIIDGVTHKARIGGQETSCVFTVDSPLLVHQIYQPGSDQKQRSLARSVREVSEPIEEVPVKLLGLFAIHVPWLRFHEHFLILGVSCKRADAYERLGLGSGKLYSREIVDIGSEVPTGIIEPFNWAKSRGADSNLGGLLPQDRLLIV